MGSAAREIALPSRNEVASEALAALLNSNGGSDVPGLLRIDLLLWRAVAESARRDLYIWGAGQAGRQVAGALRQRGGRVTGFVETGCQRVGQLLDDCPVVTADDLVTARTSRPAPFVLVASRYATAIIESLRAISWPVTDFAVIDLDPLFPAPPARPPRQPAVTPEGPPPPKYTDAVDSNWLGQVFTYPWPLEEVHLRRCRVSPSREAMLAVLPQGGIVAEVGTYYGRFARLILSMTRPAVLHLIDVNTSRLEREFLEDVRGDCDLRIREADSVDTLETFPDEHFDWIYIDGDHSYEGVRRDAMVAMRKITRDGLIVFNDYTAYSPLELCAYGTMHVVHELCRTHGFEVTRLALQGLGYQDVVLQRRADLA